MCGSPPPTNATCAHRDPDSVVLCVLATDEEDEGDIALQIHFTLIQAFCCDNDIHILRVSGMQRLATILGEPEPGAEPRDLHCLLVTVSGTVMHGHGPVIHPGRRAKGGGGGVGGTGHGTDSGPRVTALVALTLVFLLPRTPTKTPGKAKGWRRWPVIAPRAGTGTSGCRTSVCRNAEPGPSRLCS